VSKPELLNAVFQCKSGQLQPIRIGNLTTERRDKLEKKKQDEKKNLMVKKMRALAIQR
jgi:hypothetical protein